MRAIVIDEPGDENCMQIGDAPVPELRPGALRIENHAAGVNRADLMQRRGMYPPPHGSSPLLGLECAGVVTEVAEGVAGFAVGDRVMALLPGGGYAAAKPQRVTRGSDGVTYDPDQYDPDANQRSR